MALTCPDSIDVTDIQFKLHNKYKIGINIGGNVENCNFLASASSLGLVIVACLQPPELRVVQLTDIVDNRESENVPLRTIPLPGTPQYISLSCDHSLLAVSILQNGTGFISIYSVASFLSTNVVELLKIPIGSNTRPMQMIWNPVIANTLAVVLDTGALEVYVIQNDKYQYFNIDKAEQAKCASWSPKGKQIVVGFPSGKLAQYKPDLKLAKTIPCPGNIFPQPFDVIAVQWLSTYQFAAVFLQQEPGSCPALHIINAPKTDKPTYINFDDICYSQSGPRKPQVYLNHVLQWNLLLVASANSMEIGVLGTIETGETPSWTQYTMLDEARAELPLTEDKQEPSPIGIALETGCKHQLTIGENKIPVMPMIHLLSTDGFLVSFNFINSRLNTPSLCSPAVPIADKIAPGLFKMMDTRIVSPKPSTEPVAPPSSYDNFGSPLGVTSTPTQKAKSIFPQNQPQIQTGNIFGNTVQTNPNLMMQKTVPVAQSTAATASPNNGLSFLQPQTKPLDQQTWSMSAVSGSTFGGSGDPKANSIIFGGNSKSAFGAAQPNVTITQQSSTLPTYSSKPQTNVIQQPTNLSKSATTAEESSKPFLTVAPVYTAPLNTNSLQPKPAATSELRTLEIDADESNAIIRKIIFEEIQSFETLLTNSLARSQTLKINSGSRDEAISVQKQINDFTDIVNQAVESTDELSSEIQSLKLSVNDAFSMAEEAKSKIEANLEINEYGNSGGGIVGITMSQTSRRQLEKLQNMLAVNEHHFQLVSKQIDGQWSAYQDMIKQNKKNQMHIPSLESVYQTLSKQREILNRQRIKIHYLKSKLGFKDLHNSSSKKGDLNISALTDSLFSMTLADQIRTETASLSKDKLISLRNVLKNHRNVPVIKPKRPSRKGLNSEIVVEKRIAQAKLAQSKSTAKATANPPSAAIKVLPKSTSSKNTQQITSGSGLIETKTFTSTVPTAFAIPPTSTSAFSNISSNKSQSSPMFGSITPQTQPPFGNSQTQSMFGQVTSPMFGSQSETSGFTLQKSTSNITIIQKKDTDTKAPASFNFGPISSPLSQTTVKPIATTKPATEGFFKTAEKPESKPLVTAPLGIKSTTEINIAAPKSAAMSFSFSTSNNPITGELSKPAFSFVNQQQQQQSSIIGAKPSGFFETAIPSPIPFESKVQFDQKPIVTVASKPNETSFKTAEKPSDKENIVPSDMPKLLTISHQAKPIANIDNNQTAIVKPQIQNKPQLSAANTAAAPNSPAAPVAGFNLNLSKSDQGAKTQQPSIVSIMQAPPNVSVTSSKSVASNEFTFSLAGLSTAVSTVPLPAATTTPPPTIAKPTATPATAILSSTANTFSFASFANAMTPPAPAKDPTDDVLQGLNICKPTVSSDSANSQNGANLFTQNAFSSPTTGSAEQASSIFGKPATTSPPQAQSGGFELFGSETATTAAATLTTIAPSSTTTTAASPFSNIFANANSTLTATASTVFGGGQPDPTSNIFSNAAAAASAPSTNFFNSTNSSFGNSSQPKTGGNIFGGSTGSGFGSPKLETASIFGGGSAVTNNQSTAGIFGNAASGSSSFFGQSSSFGDAVNAQQQQPNAGSIFGGGSTTATSSFSFNQPNLGNSFSNPSPFSGGSAGGSFNQNSGPLVAETGFGGVTATSPSGASGGNIFGQQSSFGQSNAVFGAPPAFGAAPSFGSPKSGFGTFANVNVNTSPTAFGGNTAQNSLFETLGSSDTGMTFGNIAQSANVQEPSFSGGSSFSSWR